MVDQQRKGGVVDMVTLHPCFVLGPPVIPRTDSTSVRTITQLFGPRKTTVASRPPATAAHSPLASLTVPEPVAEGKPMFTRRSTHSLHVVDVRDVARAHIAAAMTPAAHGRYLISSRHAIPVPHIVQLVQEHAPVALPGSGGGAAAAPLRYGFKLVYFRTSARVCDQNDTGHSCVI